MASMSVQKSDIDVEQCARDTLYLSNTIVQDLAWRDVTVSVYNKETKSQKKILTEVSGFVGAGEQEQHKLYMMIES